MAHAERFPPGSNTVNVTTYGAVGDGVTDDTAAFIAATQQAAHYGHIMVIPCGPNLEPRTYLLSAPIEAKILHQGAFKWVANWIVKGEGADCAKVRLAPNSPAFQDPAQGKGKGVFVFGSTVGGIPSTVLSGSGVEAFRNSIYDLTIEIGPGNPGAHGVDWVCNNRGVLRGVRIVDPTRTAWAGIYMGRPYPGPCLVSDVEVEGFRYAAWSGQVQYGTTFYEVAVSDQTVCGLSVGADAFHIEKLASENTVPAVCTPSPSGHLTIIDSLLTGGAANKSAIDLGADAHAFVRDVTTVGYQSAIKKGTTVLPGLDVTEWWSHPPFTLWDEPAATLRLPAPPPPDVFYSADPNDWADVRAYGANPAGNADDRAGWQAAMNSGKPIVYSPKATAGGATVSQYWFGGTVDVPASVKRITCMESTLHVNGAYTAGSPLFRFIGGQPGDVTTIENCWGQAASLQGGRYLELDERTVYVRDVQLGGPNLAFVTKPGDGDLVISDVVTHEYEVHGSSMRAWQINPESFDVTQGQVNEGGTIRILGEKTEGMGEGGNATHTTIQGRTEVLGGVMMPCVQFGPGNPPLGLVSIDSDVSYVYTNWCGKPNDEGSWQVQVRETRGSETREILRTELPIYTVSGGTKRFMALFSGRGKPEPKQVLLVLGDPNAPKAIEAAMVEQLEGGGYVVTVADDLASTSADADGKDAVVISGSVGVGNVGTKFRDATAGVVVCEPFLLDDVYMGMTATAFGQATAKTMVSVVSSHPLSAGLPAGSVAVYPSAARVAYGRAVASGDNVALAEGLTNHYAVFGYDAGDAMEGGFVAPGRRVGCFIDELAPGLTAQGWQLFDSAIEWAAGQ